MTAGLWDDAEVIHAYTRAQALADGNLHDVTELAAEAGFSIPVAITAAVKTTVDAIPESRSWEDTTGRLWDVVWMASNAARRARAARTDRVDFTLILPVGRKINQRLTVHVGPGDTAAPVVTIGFPSDF